MDREGRCKDEIGAAVPHSGLWAEIKPPIFRGLCFGDSYENRTRVSAVRGRCLSRLTKEPFGKLSSEETALTLYNIYCRMAIPNFKNFYGSMCIELTAGI